MGFKGGVRVWVGGEGWLKGREIRYAGVGLDIIGLFG